MIREEPGGEERIRQKDLGQKNTNERAGKTISGTGPHGRLARLRFSSAWFLAGCTVLLSGCTVGPTYHRPTTKVPEHWSEPLRGGENNGLAQIKGWWREFEDPELDSLVDRMVRANLQIRVAAGRVREARAQRSMTAGGYWPTANASASYTQNRISEHYFLPLPPGTPLDYNWYQAGFDASWELDVFGGTRRAVEAATAEVAAAEFSQRDITVSLLAELARDYVEARGSQAQLVIARENIAAQTDSLRLTQDRYRAGLASELDVQQAAALLATTQARIPTLETMLEASVHRLGVLLAQPPGSLAAELAAPVPIPSPPPRVPVGLPSELLLRRPDVQQAERSLAAATARIGMAKADLFPRFSLTGNAGFQSVSAGEWFTPGSLFWTTGPTATWRVFDAGRIRANIVVQTARQEQALETYEQTALNAFEEVENALVAYAKEQDRSRSLERSVEAERAALGLAQDLYRNGLADFLRVLDSERSLYEAEDALVLSRKAVTENLIALYKALGGGWGP